MLFVVCAVCVLCDGQQLNFCLLTPKNLLPVDPLSLPHVWIFTISSFVTAIQLLLVKNQTSSFCLHSLTHLSHQSSLRVLVGVLVAPSFFFSVSEDSSSWKISGLNLLVASPDWDFSRILSWSFLDSSCYAGKTEEPVTGAQIQI